MVKLKTYALAFLVLVSLSLVAADKMDEVLAIRKAEIEKSRLEFSKAVERSDQRAITSLRALLKTAKDDEKVTLYKTILSVDGNDVDAVKYFTALGILDRIRADIGIVPAAPVANNAADNKLKPIAPGPRMEATFYAKSVDSFSIYLNGQRLFTGTNAISKKVGSIAIGDIITVKTSNRKSLSNGYGFSCAIKASNGAVITTNLRHWKGYTPKNETIWYQIDQIDGIAGVEAANQSTQEAVSNAASVDCTSIWGVGHENISYIFLQVSPDVFVPAK